MNKDEKEIQDKRHNSRLNDPNVRVVRVIRVAKCERKALDGEPERCDGRE